MSIRSSTLPSRRRFTSTLAVVAALAAIGLGATLVNRDQSAASAQEFRAHGGLVPDTPRRDHPIILKTPNIGWEPRQVLAAEQVGQMIVAGGNFLSVEPAGGGEAEPSPYLVAYDIADGRLVCHRQFRLNGEVRAIEPGPSPTQVYIAGRFSRVAGADGVERSRPKVALVDFADCSVDRGFAVWSLDGKIDELELFGKRLFLGGDFTQVGNDAIESLAEVDARTGAVNPSFRFDVGDDFRPNMPSVVRGMEVNAAGTRLIIGGRFHILTQSGTSITSHSAIIDISDRDAPRLTGHTFIGPHEEDINVSRGQSLQDVAVSPDGTRIAFAYGTTTAYDWIYLVPAVETPTTATWSTFMRDSTFGIGISDHAVYAAGHFCRIDEGPGQTDVMTPNTYAGCGGAQSPGGVWRSQLAALSITDGTPLTWNPGNDAYRGGTSVTVTNRGLLVGYDGERTNRTRVGALAFFDFGADRVDSQDPSAVTLTAPTAGTRVDNPVEFRGRASDAGTGVAAYELELISDDGRWWDLRSGWSATRVVNRVGVDGQGRLRASADLPAGRWTLRARARDGVDRPSPRWTEVVFSTSGSDQQAPRMSFDDEGGELSPVDRLTLTGSARDNLSVERVRLRVRNAAGAHVSPRGLRTARYDYRATLDPPSAGETSWTVPLATVLPPGDYTVEGRVRDAAGNVGRYRGSFTVPAEFTRRSAVFSSYTPGETFDQSYTAGFQFQVSAERRLTALGIFDENGDGILNNPEDAEFALWTTAGVDPIATGVVRRRTPAPTGWAYADFDRPVVLRPGVTYIAAHEAFSGGELTGWSSPAELAPGSVVTVLGDAWVNGRQLRYPTQSSDPTNPGGVPNLILEETIVADPEPDPDPDPVGGCAVSPAGGGLAIEWTPIEGQSDYQVRRNNRWIADVTGTSYTDRFGDLGADYEIRHRSNGTPTDRPCRGGDPPDAATCVIEAVDGTIRLTWPAIAGETVYQVRRNGSWLASLGGTSWTDPNPVDGASYEIRNRQNGQTNDRSCR